MLETIIEPLASISPHEVKEVLRYYLNYYGYFGQDKILHFVGFAAGSKFLEKIGATKKQIYAIGFTLIGANEGFDYMRGSIDSLFEVAQSALDVVAGGFGIWYGTHTKQVNSKIKNIISRNKN
jgi:hypothetical protein